MKALMIYGHPHPEMSLGNKTIMETVKAAVPDLDIRQVAELYPDGKFDIKTEQEALAAADTIILQFPVYWYAYPALLKKYIEDVFAHGFAYGSTGTRLRGKTLIVSCTTGAPYDAYAEGKVQSHTVDSYMFPAAQLARLCGMRFGGVLHTGGVMYIPGVSKPEDREPIIKACQAHGAKLASLLK